MPPAGRSFSRRFRWPAAPAQVIVGGTVFLLALIHLKAVVGYPHGFQDLHWESGFFLGEASVLGSFLHFFRAVVLDFGDSIQTHLSLGVDPTAAAWADEIRSFLTTEHTI